LHNYIGLKSLRAFVLLNLTLIIVFGFSLAEPVLAAGNPVVTSTNPSDTQERVDVNLPIYITFDRDMDSSTMTSANLNVRDSQAQDVQARGIHYDSTSKTTVFIPLAPLKQDETYQLTVKTGVKDTNGLPLLQDYLVSFKTTLSSISPEPRVISTIPKASVSQIGTKRVISASFNHDMNPNTINNMTFTVVDQNKNPVTPKSITYDTLSRIAAFVPVSPLTTNTLYTVTLKGAPDGTGIKDSGGVNLVNYTWSFTTGNTDLNDPHGNYIVNTNTCATCHQTHDALNTSLLNKTTETALCFTCHDGSGSNYNINAGMVDTTNNQSFHPIMDTGNLATQQLLYCSDCHDPHGDKDAQGNYYNKLLKATDGTTTAYQGNEFCLICHGVNDRKFTPTYYGDTAGNHTNPLAAHYDTTKSALDSSTKITCSKCHTPHSGRYNQLTDQQEENLCLTCHTNPANSHSGTGNIQEQFFGSSTVTIVSKHDITSSDNGKVECSSCHGPHTVGAASLSEGKAYSDLSDPTNTKSVFTTVAGTLNATIGNMTDFCLKCHAGTPPSAIRTSDKVVPYSIQFPSFLFTTSTGWNKTVYLNSKHYLSGVSCNDCHIPHGSPYPSLMARGEDTVSTDGECLKCHGGTPPAAYATAKNVSTDFKSVSQHPTLTISSLHSDTETAADKMTKRHAECVDCHDPHSPARTVKTGKDLCYDCHSSSTYTGTIQNATTSKFSDPTVANLHLNSNHSGQACTACHTAVPHGTSHPGLLALTGEVNSTSQIQSFTVDGLGKLIGSANNWTKNSCTTSCHTVP